MREGIWGRACGGGGEGGGLEGGGVVKGGRLGLWTAYRCP